MKDPDNPDKRSKWLKDVVTPDLVQNHRIRKVLYSGHTHFQQVAIVDTYNYGICLVLDGKIQSSQHDEFVYHEALVHPAMLSHPDPSTVFIAGGGEGATLREVLKYKSLKKAVMVDLDRQVVDLCRRFLPHFHQGSFDDPKIELHFADARKYLEKHIEKFDVAIIDIVDPLEAGPACLLYTQEYYELVKRRLNKDGIMVIQSGSCGWTNLHIFTSIVNTLKTVFPVVRPYHIYMPSFVDQWGFTTASVSLDPGKLPLRDLRRIVKEKLNAPVRSLDSISYPAMFMLPKMLRKKISRSKKIIKDASPVFI